MKKIILTLIFGLSLSVIKQTDAAILKKLGWACTTGSLLTALGAIRENLVGPGDSISRTSLGKALRLPRHRSSCRELSASSILLLFSGLYCFKKM